MGGSVTIGGSNISGVISTGDHANIRLSVKNIGALPGSDPEKEEVKARLEELESLLKTVPPEKAADAKELAEFTEDFVKEAGAEQPSPRKIKMTSAGMIDAAKAIEGVVPRVFTVVQAITQFAVKMGL